MSSTADASANTDEGSKKSESKPELVITRTFDAPRALVYDAWTKPEHLERWGGAPEGMTLTDHGSDVRTGGGFHVTMHGSDGSDHELKGEYLEVVPPEKLVFTHTWIDGDGNPRPSTFVTMTFVERGGKTELTMHQTGFASVESRDGHRIGWSSELDRFGNYLASLS